LIASGAYDVFVSYRYQEPYLSWVRKKLTPALRAKAVRVCLDVDDFLLGQPIVRQMEAAVQRSRYTLLVLGPAYFEGTFARAEHVMAKLLGEEEARQRLLSVILRTCDTANLQVRLSVDMRDESAFDAGIDRLAGAIRGVAKAAQ
jgi:hypothetical protein